MAIEDEDSMALFPFGSVSGIGTFVRDSHCDAPRPTATGIVSHHLFLLCFLFLLMYFYYFTSILSGAIGFCFGPVWCFSIRGEFPYLNFFILYRGYPR